MTTIEIRLSLHTIYGPVGPRLGRGTPLPVKEFTFPNTPEGQKEAAEAKDALEKYLADFEARREKGKKK